MVRWHRIAEIGKEFGKLLGKIMRHDMAAVPLQRERRPAVGAKRSPDPEIDPARRQGGEESKCLGHFERGIVRQHDATRTNPNALRLQRYWPDQNLGCSPSQARRCMMLGQPIAMKAQGIAMPGEIEGVPYGIGSSRSLGDRGLIQNGQSVSGVHCRAI